MYRVEFETDEQREISKARIRNQLQDGARVNMTSEEEVEYLADRAKDLLEDICEFLTKLEALHNE